MDFPAWFDGKTINETLFCEEFLAQHPMVSVNDTFFTKNGRITDENALKKEMVATSQSSPMSSGSWSRRRKIAGDTT